MSFRREIKYYLASNFLYFHEKVGLEDSPTVIYENGIRSSYDNFISELVKKDFSSISLDLKFLNKNFFNKYSFDFYDSCVFFHSPGEPLQRYICTKLCKKKLPKSWYGFQHGLIGKSPPKGLAHVLSKSKVTQYISIESTFSDALHNYSNANVLEFLQPLGIYEDINPESGSSYDIYFDAPDMEDFSYNFEQCRIFFKTFDCSISNLFFHPSTSNSIKKYVTKSLSKHFTNEKIMSGAICWKTKFKFDLADRGVPIFSLKSANEFNMIKLNYLLPNTYVSTTKHLREIFNQLGNSKI